MTYKFGMISNNASIILIVISLLIFLISLWYSKTLVNHVFGVAVFIALFTFGIILSCNENRRISILENKQSLLLATISDFPAEKGNSYMFTAELKRILSDSLEKSIRGSMVFYHRKDTVVTKFRPGDMLLISCTPVEISNRGNPCEFDYKSYMMSNGIRYYAYTDQSDIRIFRPSEKRKIRHQALILREKIIRMYEERGVDGERLPLVAAITLGQKNMLESDTRQIFSNAGIMHIMAVSGLHVVILSLFIMNLLFFLKRRLNPLRIIITLVLIWAFAFLTGLSPSVLRATIMFTFLQAGNLMSRKVNGINSVLASAFILLVLQPSVITDAGFLLSYAAVIYIMAFYNDFYRKISFRYWLPDKIWQSVVVTLVAQAGTLPLTIMLFNRFPVYFILTNLIIVPLSNLIIITGSLIPMTFHFIKVSTFLASVLDKLTWLTEYLTRRAASLPLATIDGIGIRPLECLILTIAVTLFIFYLLNKRTISILIPLTFFVMFTAAIGFKKVGNQSVNELIVYNTPVLPATAVQKGNELYLYTRVDSLPKEVVRHAATMGLRVRHIVLNGEPVLIESGKTRILLTDSLCCRFISANKCDILIITGRRPVIESCMQLYNYPEKTIISPDVGSYFTLKYNKLKTGDFPFYVRKSGAYISKLD